MVLIDFLVKNFVLLIMLTGMFMITVFDVYLDKSMIRKLRIVLCLILALVIFDTLETYTGNLETFTYWRIPLSVICYSLRPTIIMMLVFIVSPKITKAIIIPAAANFLISSTAFFTDISFTFEQSTNFFIRGPLGYTPYIITVLYIILIYCVTIRTITTKFSEEGTILLFIALNATLAAIISYFNHDEIVHLTYASDVLLYYMYLYAQYTKRDPLTSVFNRQTFQSDLKKHPKTITGIISADLNDLKYMNDKQGHLSGDAALKTVTRCFCKSASRMDRVYRVGGDEFAIICHMRKPEDMEKLVDDIKSSVNSAGYSVALGLSYGKSVGEMLEEADELMYLDKARFKKELKEKGIVHTRE